MILSPEKLIKDPGTLFSGATKFWCYATGIRKISGSILVSFLHWGAILRPCIYRTWRVICVNVSLGIRSERTTNNHWCNESKRGCQSTWFCFIGFWAQCKRQFRCGNHHVQPPSMNTPRLSIIWVRRLRLDSNWKINYRNLKFWVNYFWRDIKFPVDCLWRGGCLCISDYCNLSNIKQVL